MRLIRIFINDDKQIITKTINDITNKITSVETLNFDLYDVL